ncbi:MAG: RDD family protein [Planctomycetota bacterium]|nr:RDD family protein [Planctomycetota bacterium]
METPEGLALGLRLAGVLPRGCALLLDTLVRGVFYMAVFLTLGWFGIMGDALITLIIFLAEWFYYVFFEVLFKGVSPGKYWVGLRVLHDDGTPVGWNASLVRNFMRAVDFLPLFYGFGVLSSSLSPSFRRLGDWAAGTVVVHDSMRKRRARGRRKVRSKPRNGSGGSVRSVPVPLVLDRDEQGALLAFLQRRGQWSQERAQELSNLLEPITTLSGEEGLQRTLGYGAWLEEEA